MKAIPEREFQQQVVDLAHIFHWQVAHFRPAWSKKGWRTAVSADGAGFPDLVLAKERRLAFLEVKSEKGRLTVAQEEWLKILKATGKCEVHTCKPSDWQEIAKLLE